MATSSDYRAAFVARTKQARTAAGYTQAQLAKLLDMPQDKYKTYEQAILLPHALIERFCLITRVSMTWLLTGQGRANAQIEEVPPPKPVPKPRLASRRA